jgi:Flp pilus assembly protein TadG
MKCATELRRLLRHSGGQSVVELAVVAPILLLMTLGILEFGRILDVSQGLTGLSRESANLAARGTELQKVVEVAMQNGADFGLQAAGGVVATQLTMKDGAPRIQQQVASGGYAGRSRLGKLGEVARGFGTVAFTDGQSVFVVETFYRYEPVTPLRSLASLSLPEELYERAIF